MLYKLWTRKIFKHHRSRPESNPVVVEEKEMKHSAVTCLEWNDLNDLTFIFFWAIAVIYFLSGAG